MDIKVVNLLKKKSEEVTLIEVDINMPLKDLKKRIVNELKISLSMSRIGLSYSAGKDPNKKISMGEDMRKLIEYENFTSDSTVYIKDIGMQFPYRLTYIIEYLGPLVFFFLFYIRLCQKGTPTLTQNICLMISTFHYIKRLLESMFVHIFSRDTMPIMNLFKNCAYYWGYYGICCGFFFFSPNYTEPPLKPLRFFFAFMCFSAEIKNLKCHLILRKLKVDHQGKKAIPNGEGFELVTCANYFWEISSWFCFSIVSCHWCFVLFTIMGFYQMRIWAIKKHKDMIKRYGDKYPKERKIIIPYIL